MYCVNINRERLEENGHQGLLCRRRIYQKTTQIWKIHSTNGMTVHFFFCNSKTFLKSIGGKNLSDLFLKHFCLLQGLRFNKAHVTHPELKATFCLPIIGVKKNPTSTMYTSLGVITKGTIIEVEHHKIVIPWWWRQKTFVEISKYICGSITRMTCSFLPE